MDKKNRDIVIGAIVIVILVFLVGYFVRKGRNKAAEPQPTSSAEAVREIEDKFKIDIPENAEMLELKNLTQDSISALAARSKTDSMYNISVLADLPDPKPGSQYSAWLLKDTKDKEFVKLGNLRIAKGGYLIDYQSKTDYSDYNMVLISEETKNDATIETKLLEGTFD